MASPAQQGSTGTVALATLGCKVNQAESDQLERRFVSAGWRLVAFDQPADAYVINSCSVTHVADRKSRQLIRHARRANPAGLIVATGCYAALAADEVVRTTPIDLVVANHDKDRLVEIVLGAVGPKPATDLTCSRQPGGRTRAFVKVQDGCDSLCSFCVIPYARGRERSVHPDAVVGAMRERVADGHKEIVLTGVHVGTYGHDLQPTTDLTALVARVLDETAVPRLRLSSIEPWDFDIGLLDLWATGRLCRHVHLALQSGSDRVLARMRRPYDRAGFANRVDAIRARIPDIAVTTDVIVGFPGESEADFAESLAAIDSLDFALVHVFPFSPRPGTPAARMPQQVPAKVRDGRVATMLVAAGAASHRYRERFIGQWRDVHYLRSRSGQSAGKTLWEGITDNYLTVVTPSDDDLSNQVIATKLVGSEGESLTGAV